MAFADEITCHENIRLLFRRPRHSKTNIATHFREIIYLLRAGNDLRPRHFFRNIYHLQLHEGNDQVKKRGREVNGSFVMYQLVFRKFLRRGDGHVERGNSSGMDD